MFQAALKKIVGTKHDREMKRLGPLVNEINGRESAMRALDDEDLRRTTITLRERIDQGASLDDLLVDAFAACREA